MSLPHAHHFSSPRRILYELSEIERLAERLSPYGRVEIGGWIHFKDERYPIHQFVLGSSDPKAPVLGLFGGVHGLEKIGTQVVLAFLGNIAERLPWDETLHFQLSRSRLISIPLVNPVGMAHLRRSNGNHVDLMRNAPIECDPGEETFLLGGHRHSTLLPWYRGPAGGPMEKESQILVDFVKAQTDHSQSTVLIDNHSGFGLFDQIWFPFAKSRAPFPDLSSVYGLKRMYDRVNPYHVYRFEPQAKNYTTHGDLWDYLYVERKLRDPNSVFLPLTLEMGSWNWVKKNPLQLFSFLGLFNPVEEHRRRRILRRHIPWFDFLMRAVVSPAGWLPENAEIKAEWERWAIEHWYSGIGARLRGVPKILPPEGNPKSVDRSAG